METNAKIRQILHRWQHGKPQSVMMGRMGASATLILAAIIKSYSLSNIASTKKTTGCFKSDARDYYKK